MDERGPSVWSSRLSEGLAESGWLLMFVVVEWNENTPNPDYGRQCHVICHILGLGDKTRKVSESLGKLNFISQNFLRSSRLQWVQKSAV
jgi:hypothetical protein